MIENTSIIFILGANIVPVIGVAFFNWQVGSILLYYWLETVVISIFSFIKIFYVSKQPMSGDSSRVDVYNDDIKNDEEFVKSFSGYLHIKFSEDSKIPFIIAFLYQTLAMLFIGFLALSSLNNNNNQMTLVFTSWQLYISTFFLFIVHGNSFMKNFLGQKEYLKLSYYQLINKSAVRVFIIYTSVYIWVYVIGIFFPYESADPMQLKQTYTLVFIFIILKTFTDYLFHKKEHSFE